MSAVQRNPDSVVITPATDVVTTYVEQLRQELHAVIDQGATHIIIDLQSVEVVDSTGLGVLIAAYKGVEAYGGRLTLINVSHDTSQLMQIMRLSRYFTIQERDAS